MAYGDDLWEGECFIVRHHEKAMLVDHDNEEYWVPYSEIDQDSDLTRDSEPNEEGRLVISYWLAKKAGWV